MKNRKWYFCLALMMLVCIFPIQAVAQTNDIYVVEVLNDRLKMCTDVNVLVSKDLVYMQPQTLCEQTGFTLNEVSDGIVFKRSLKKVKVNKDKSRIEYGNIIEPIDRIIERDGRIWLPMEQMLHFLNARCDMVDGMLMITSAEHTCAEFIDAFYKKYLSGEYKIDVYEQSGQSDTMLTTRIVTSSIWDTFTHPFKSIKDFVYAEDHRGLFTDMVRADESSTTLIKALETMDSASPHADYLNALLKVSREFGDAVPSVIASMDDCKFLGNVLEGYDIVSFAVDLGDISDAIKYMRIAKDSFSGYADALDYGFVDSEATDITDCTELWESARDVIEMYYGCMPSKTAFEMFMESLLTTSLDSVVGVLTAPKMAAEKFAKSTISYLNDRLKNIGGNFKDQRTLTKFQRLNEGAYTYAENVFYDNEAAIDEEAVKHLKYAALLYLRTAMMFYDARNNSTMVDKITTDFNTLLMYNDEDLFLDSLDYMSEYNVKGSDVLENCTPTSGANTPVEATVDMTDKGSLEQGNTSGNIVNGGIAAESDGWIYYRSNDGGSIYKMKNDGSENTKLGGANARYINVLDDTIFYSNRGDNTICSMKTDGTQHEVVRNGCGGQIFVIGDSIYFNSSVTMRMGLDGRDEQQVSAHPFKTIYDNTVIYDEHIYDTDVPEIYLLADDLGTDNDADLISKGEDLEGAGGWNGYGYVQVFDNKVYYAPMDHAPGYGSIYCHDLSTEITAEVGAYQPYEGINVTADFIFNSYIDYDRNICNIIKTSLTGKELSTIVAEYFDYEHYTYFYNVCIAGDWIFFMQDEETKMVPIDTVWDGEIVVPSEYLIPGSDTRYITEADLEGFDADTARLSRNEIFARYGYTFTDAALQTYFDDQSWYKQNQNVNKSNMPQLNTYEENNIKVIIGYEDWLNSNQSGMPILDTALYDYPIVRVGHWKDSSISEFIFNDMVESDNGYIVTCEIIKFTEEDDGFINSNIINTKQLYIAKDTVVHCINAWWTTRYDYYEKKTFEEFLNEGSSYGIWPDFYADIRGNQIVEMAEVYTP